MRTAALTAAALFGFAANSILCRMALQPGLVDAATFTTIRLVSGAVVLLVLARTSAREPASGGSWASAAALGGLVALVRPGLAAPDPAGAALMLAAGVAWGVYSLRGRGIARPLAATASNFARAVPLTLGLSLAAPGPIHLTGRGAVLAIASGALASGVGYSLWYAALRRLTASRAAVLQLLVPVLAAAAAVMLLGEELGARLVLAGAAIIGGVALAAGGKRP